MFKFNQLSLIFYHYNESNPKFAMLHANMHSFSMYQLIYKNISESWNELFSVNAFL